MTIGGRAPHDSRLAQNLLLQVTLSPCESAERLTATLLSFAEI
jgi:hypothetical protein